MKKPNTKRTWEEITPDRAIDMLNRSDALATKGFIQRALNRVAVRQLAEEITDGRFRGDNCQAIGISKRGAVVNGMHRLHSVVRAGKSIWIFVERGVPEDTFTSFDTGTVRTAATFVQHAGHKHAQLAAAAASLLVSYFNRSSQAIGGTIVRRASRSKVADRVGSDALLREVVENTSTLFAGSSGRFPAPSIIAFCWRLVAKVNKRVAEDFFEAVATGTGLAANDPAWVLRERLLDLRGKLTHSTRVAMIFYILRAFDAYQNGSTISRLRMPEGADAVEFPRITRPQ